PHQFYYISYFVNAISLLLQFKVGACIINEDKKIVGIGYNGMPRGCDDSSLPWEWDKNSQLKDLYGNMCHAEMNAILNKNCAKISGCKMYVAQFPCNGCAKFIIQEEIRELIYFLEYEESPEIKAAKKLLSLAGVKYRFVQPFMYLFLIMHYFD
ncbi:UNVERIFIED_CONTAM: hypothetical protein GTU68_055100, partial [Idotea baltica]|nr:hypothetical protein [Idotea baltica]